MAEVRAQAFSVQMAEWPEAQAALRAVRTAVFIVEQSVAPEQEWDSIDPLSRHVLARSTDGSVIGTGRLASDGKIGRMPVLASCRGMGVGTSMLELPLQEAAQRGLERCYLHALSQAVPFYRRHGFEAEGQEFMEGAIPHRHMHIGL
jgi:predicted GNAT family N-acyltransferase